MTMYLPNTDVHPTGYEPGEFIEPPAWPTTGDSPPRSPEDEDVVGPPANPSQHPEPRGTAHAEAGRDATGGSAAPARRGTISR